MTTDTRPALITDIDDAETADWLRSVLAPATQRAHQVPSAEALERIRARIFEPAPAAADGNDERRIAA